MTKPNTTPTEDQSKRQNLLLNGLNPEQNRAVSGKKSEGIQVIAGAGTGKTHLISRRFAYLIESLNKENIPNPEEKILAVTFTVKAAREMHERINSLLTSQKMDGLSPYTAITNFHGFCNKLLRRHALDIGLTPDFSILGGLEQTLLITRLFDGIKHNEYANISSALKRAGLDELIPANCLSVDVLQELPIHPIERILDDLPDILNKIKSTGLSPRQFFETAQAQSRQLTQTLKTLPIRNLEGEFFEDNETYARLWNHHLKNLGDNSWEFSADDEREYKAQISWLAKYNYQKQKPFVWYNGTRKKFESGTEDTDFLDDIQKEEEQFIQTTAAVYALYQYTLHQQNLCDFDDLINRSLELFETHPKLKAHYQNEYEAIIVDEFQDSNGSQLRLMQQLLKPNSTQMTVVGDLKQSIYGFRHAQPENMGLIFEGRNYQGISLHTNYRSQGPILKVANTLAEMITGDQSQRLDLSPDNEALNNSPLVTWVDLGRKEEKETKDGIVLKHQEKIAKLKEREAIFIAREIAQLITSKKYEAKDIAILVSTHKRADEIEFELRHLGIPAIKQKNKGFFKEPIIHDAMALLRLLHNPHHDAALIRILQKKLSQRQLRLLSQQKKPAKNTENKNKIESLALFQVLVKLGDSSFLPEFSLSLRTALINLSNEITRARKIMTRADLVFSFLHLADTLGLIDPQAPFDKQVESRTHLNLFKKLLYQLVQDSSLSPSLSEVLATLEQYQLDSNLDLPHSDDDFSENAVRLMTIHIAKGLEFLVVFAAYTEASGSGRGGQAPYLHFDPQYKSKDGFGLFIQKHNGGNTLKAEVYKNIWQKPREEAENKRKFYVAVTRAEEKLYVLRGPKSQAFTDSELYPQKALELVNEDENPDAFYEKYRDPDLDAHWQEKIKAHFAESNPQANAENEQSKTREAIEPSELPKSLLKGKLQEPLSFSKLKTFDHCPTKYWLKYVGHLPETTTAATAIGTAVHKLIEKHYVNEGQLLEEDINLFLSHSFPETEASKRDEARQLFQQFCQSDYRFDALMQQGIRLETEKPIQFPVQLPETQANPTPSSLVLFKGNIDLLLFDSDKQSYTLIDFKTDKNLSPEKQALYFQQLALYREGLSALWPERTLPDNQMKLIHLTAQGAQEYSVNGSPSADLIKQNIVPIQTLHQENRLPQRSLTADCQACSYQKLCPQSPKN